MAADLAKLISQYREKRGLSQEALARLIGISQPQVGQLESGKDVPSLQTLRKIAIAFKLTDAEVGRIVLDVKGRPPGRIGWTGGADFSDRAA